MQHHPSHQINSPDFSDWIPVVLLVLAALMYYYSVVRICNSKSGWYGWRTLSFTAGIVMLIVAMLPSIMHWAHQDLRGHMVQHLLIGMYAPLFLVLGAPILLALKALPVSIARVMTYVLRSHLFYILSHPFTAFILNIGGMYLLYLTPLYIMSLNNPILHYGIHLHFLLAGYLFTWSLIGQEPVQVRVSFNMRVFMLFISIAFHAFLSKFMYAYLYPLNSPHSSEQIEAASKLMYYWGDLSELLLTIALFAAWYRERKDRKDLILTRRSVNLNNVKS